VKEFGAQNSSVRIGLETERGDVVDPVGSGSSGIRSPSSGAAKKLSIGPKARLFALLNMRLRTRRLPAGIQSTQIQLLGVRSAPSERGRFHITP